MAISAEQRQEIEQEMFGLVGTEAKIKAGYLAAKMGFDISRIYHYSKSVRPGRQKRKDQGILRAVSDEDLKQLLVYTVQHDFSAPHLAMVAEENGININPGTYNRILRKKRLSRRENKINLQPFRRWEAEYPNQLHQIDSTVAQQFYLDDDGSVGYESPSQRYKNKAGNRKPRLVLIQVIDDHSRVKYARFTLGNHYLAWMEALYNFWIKKSVNYFPAYGLCKILYSDNDSVIKSKRFTKAMEKLGVKIQTHEVGNSQAKGKVENGFRVLQEFEKVTKIKKWSSLDEANEALFDFLIWYNSRPHSSTKERPFERWLKIDPATLVNAPGEELFNLLHLDFCTRLIHADLHVEMFGKQFQLPRRQPFVNYVGKRVEICWYPRDDERIFVIIEEKDYEILYSKPDVHAVGEFKHVMQPDSVKLKEEIEEMETPEWKLTGFYAEKFGAMWMPKEGQEFDESKIMADMPSTTTMRTKHWFITTLQDRFILETPIMPVEKRWVEGIFKGEAEMPEQELLEIFKKVESGEIIIHQNNQSAQAG